MLNSFRDVLAHRQDSLSYKGKDKVLGDTRGSQESFVESPEKRLLQNIHDAYELEYHFTPQARSAILQSPASDNSTSTRHGFRDNEDETNIALTYLHKNNNVITRASHHGFLGYPDNSDDESDTLPNGSIFFRSTTSPEKLQDLPSSPYSPAVSHTTLGESFALPHYRNRKAFELILADSTCRNNTEEIIKINDLKEFQELSYRLLCEASRREALREKFIEQEQLRRRALLESDAKTQRQLMKKFEEEERIIQQERLSKAEKVKMLLTTESAYDIEEVRTLWQQIQDLGVPLSSAFASDLSKLLNSSEDILKQLKQIINDIELCDESDSSSVDMDQMKSLLRLPLAQRMVNSGRSDVLLRASQIIKAESLKLEQIRILREEIELPSIPKLDELRRGISAINDDPPESQVLALSFDFEDILMFNDPSIPLSKKQRLQLWTEAFKDIVWGAAASEGNSTADLYSVLAYGIFYLLKTRADDAVFSRAARVFMECVHKANSVCVPSFSILGEATARGGALKGIIRMLGGIASLGLEKPFSVATTWTWLVKAIKLLQKAILKLTESQTDKNANAVIGSNVLDCCVAISAYLHSRGGEVLFQQYHHLILDNGAGGILYLLKLALDTFIERFLSKLSYSAEDRDVFVNLQKFVDSCTLSKRLISDTTSHSTLVNEDALQARMVSLLAERRLVRALQVMAEEEFNASASLLQAVLAECTRKTQQDSVPATPVMKMVSEYCFALINFLKTCGCTLTAEQRTLLFSAGGMLDTLKATLTVASARASVSDGDAVREMLETTQTLLSAGFVDAAATKKDRHAMCTRSLALLTEKRRLCAVNVLGRAEFAAEREMDSIPYKLNTVPGMLSKTTCERLINGLVDRILVEKPHLLLFALATIAKEIVDKCSSENFAFKIAANPANIVATIHGVIASTGSEDFIIFVKAEMYRHCPQIIPRLGDNAPEDGLSNGVRSVLCVYGLCCVRDGGFATTASAWRWIANMINWCRSQRRVAPMDKEPCLDLYVLDLFNIFLRVVSETMYQKYGKHYINLLRTILSTIVPLIRHPLLNGKPVDDKLSEFLREASMGKFLPIFG